MAPPKTHQERRYEKMRQGKLFFEEMAYQRLDKGKDPLVTLAETVDWRIFEEPLRAFRESLRTTDSPAGRKPFDPLLMFKILVLQSLYNLSDDAMEGSSSSRMGCFPGPRKPQLHLRVDQ